MLLSTFFDYTDTTPREESLDNIVNMIRNDVNLIEVTRAYRATGDHKVKARSRCFAPACRFQGGKAARNVVGVTGLSLADFDHLDDDRLSALREKVNGEPHTLLSYTTISGKGLRVIFRYEVPEGYSASRLKSYYERRVFPLVNEYYNKTFGSMPDMQCKNLTRLSGMCHDPQAFFRPDAEVFSIADIEEIDSRLSPAGTKPKGRGRNITQRIINAIDRELDGQGIVYEPHHRNEYIMRTGYLLNAYGVSIHSACEWAYRRFRDYDGDIDSIMRSCYRNTEEFGSRRLASKKADPEKRFATVEDIERFLAMQARFRHNVITNKIEHCAAELQETREKRKGKKEKES